MGKTSKDTRTPASLGQREQHLWNFALSASPAGLWHWDLLTDAVFWSEGFIKLIGADPLNFQPHMSEFYNRLHPSEAEKIIAWSARSFTNDEIYSDDFRLKHEGGHYIWVRANSQTIFSDAGEPHFLVGSITDINALKITQIDLEDRTQKLEASNSDLEQFAYVASHDLKAPLRGLDNLAQWIAEDLGDDVDEDIKEKLELMQGRVARMEALLADILAYSRAGSKESPPEVLDLHAVISEIVEWIDPPPGFAVKVVGELPRLFASRTIVEHIFLNLISNGIKHNLNSSGFVEISCQESENMFEISIIDDGGGIAPEHHEQIFQMFTTLKARDKVEGSGVGLAIVKKMLTSIGQEIWVESPGKYGGAEFHFTMPKT